MSGYRGARFDAGTARARNNDLLKSQPSRSGARHPSRLLPRGRRHCPTNTFSSTSIAQPIRHAGHRLRAQFEGAGWCAPPRPAENEDGKKRFVAGAARADQPHRVDLAGFSNPGFRASHSISCVRPMPSRWRLLDGGADCC